MRRMSLLRLERIIHAYPTIAGAIGAVAGQFARAARCDSSGVLRIGRLASLALLDARLSARSRGRRAPVSERTV
jgi:hypothetical protein